jgi:hypothetical protein
MIGTGSKFIKNVDDFLTLEGLRIIWERNGAARKDAASASTVPKASSKPSSPAQSKPAQSKSEPKPKNGEGAPAPSPTRPAR